MSDFQKGPSSSQG